MERQVDLPIAQVRDLETQELSRLDKLIAAARALTVEVKMKATALAGMSPGG